MSSRLILFSTTKHSPAYRELRNVVAYRPTYFRAAEMLILRQRNADELISLENTSWGLILVRTQESHGNRSPSRGDEENMKSLRLGAALLLLLAVGCAPVNNQSFPANQSAAGWSILYSPGMPSRPTAAGPGAWYFDFPTDPNYPACVSNPNEYCKSVNYVTNSYSGPAAHSVSMTFQVLTTGSPTFNWVMESDNVCSTPATVRLLLERRDDDLTQEFYRWWSNPIVFDLQATSGDFTLTAPITPDQWSSVYGKFGSQDATTLAGFQDALRNLGHVGMTFGGGCFFGHGVNISGGTARFSLISYTVS